MTCHIDGCPRPASARGWCQRHYDRWKRYGDPDGPAPRLPDGYVRAPEAAQRAEISYRQLDYWDHLGLVQPTIRQRGSGTQRGYTLDEVDDLFTVGQLAALGMDPSALVDYTPKQRRSLLAAFRRIIDEEEPHDPPTAPDQRALA